MPNTKDVLVRIALLQKELADLAAYVAADSTPVPITRAPSKRKAPAPAAPARAAKSSSSSSASSSSPIVIGPAEAAEILGVARATVDRRIKRAGKSAAHAPTDISRGDQRARWRWPTEDALRAWWAASK